MIIEELLIQPVNQGMQLVPPSEANTHLHRVKDILHFPINVFFQYPGGIIAHCNEHTFLSIQGKELGYYSHHDLEGKKFEEYVTKESANNFINADKKVLFTGHMHILEEEGILLHNNLLLSTLSFKFPCYLNKDKSPFIFGLSIVLDKTVSASGISLADGLQYILRLGLLPSSGNASGKIQLYFQREIQGVHITKKQYECLTLATQGMTAKKIAMRLGISFRTVERHFENLKHRLNVKSKSELIEKFIHHFF